MHDPPSEGDSRETKRNTGEHAGGGIRFSKYNHGAKEERRTNENKPHPVTEV